MRDWTIPIHAACFSRECQSAFVADFIKGSVVAVSLIVERYLDGLDFAANDTDRRFPGTPALPVLPARRFR